MSSRWSAYVLGIAALGLASSCQKDPPPPPPPVAPVAPPPPTVLPPPASAHGQSQPDCVGPFTQEGATIELKLGARTARRTGALLELTSPDADDQVVFGVIANLKEGTGENFFNIKRFVEFFNTEKVEAILVAGDSGETKEGIASVLEPLAKTGIPLFVIPGNRESRADFRAALDGLAAKHSNVVDMTRVRLVKFDDASVLSLPGYYDRRYIHVGEAGCQYYKEDVDALSAIAAAAAQPAVLLSHAEFFGKGNDAIDAFGAPGDLKHAGDLNLLEFLKSHPVPFGVFANIHEGGGRATDLDSKLAKEGEAQARLYVNAGLADSTPWKLNDGSWSYGMAATLTVKGQQASYKMLRLKQLSEPEQAEARKLEPATAALSP